ncbi:unnamed protein product [Arctia plantaginis]|uniref:Uncharacterized protein n=1 Tax=Arctia plantaginis TaxID=874455 RepID=A0A8S1AWC1_ARCPL|nr:unnamed protein product [Arctia plantaginis]
MALLTIYNTVHFLKLLRLRRRRNGKRRNGASAGTRTARALWSSAASRFTQQRGTGLGFGDGAGRISQCQGCGGGGSTATTRVISGATCAALHLRRACPQHSWRDNIGGYPLRYLGEDSHEDEKEQPYEEQIHHLCLNFEFCQYKSMNRFKKWR